MSNKKHNFISQIKGRNKSAMEDVLSLSSNLGEIFPNIISTLSTPKEANNDINEEIDQPHFIGHRSRLKERFLQTNPNSFSEYELLELILYWAIPRKDVKPLAKALIKEFGDLGGVIKATEEKLKLIPGVTKPVYTNFLIINEIVSRLLQINIKNKNILSSWSALLDYLRVTMGGCKTEQFRILFLNRKNILISDELQTLGTIDQTPVYPREVIKRALFHEASAIILVHNHPSGDPTPSKADLDLTNAIINGCKSVGIEVHDHVIITKDDFYSFKSNLLII